MVWQKGGGVQPAGSCQHDVEFIVAGVRGTPRFTSGWSFSSVITAPCADPGAGHSVKPKKFYDLLRRFTPGPRLELPEDGVRHWPVWEEGRV
jgi:N6-adenosine-specific RNA methylase IME4